MRTFVLAIGAVSLFAVAPAASAQERDYPICHGAMQDGCQNPGEGGAPGHSRASDYDGGPAAYGDAGHHAWAMHHRHHHRRRHHHR